MNGEADPNRTMPPNGLWVLDASTILASLREKLKASSLISITKCLAIL